MCRKGTIFESIQRSTKLQKRVKFELNFVSSPQVNRLTQHVYSKLISQGEEWIYSHVQ